VSNLRLLTSLFVKEKYATSEPETSADDASKTIIPNSPNNISVFIGFIII